MSRELITQWFENELKSMTIDTPLGNTTSFVDVTRDPMESGIIGKMAVGEMVAGVYDLDESVDRISTGENRKFLITIEFYLRPLIGEYKSTQLNKILTDLELHFRKTQAGGLAMLVNEINNSIDIDGIFDRVIGGSITFEVMYRVGYC